ncbi:amidohydrolase family protein [Gracilimonas mengyeensis]|uniref:Imidazolonepropionase n=1 Tax=Gracilimonas mengyeensis TaxID=1302730 RepID=A0A521D5C0_9BACT|nr:amidohydrolase family protein [Gracilimonas mengyeensis]SMO66884.1 Imidazolonepropionase [Gracilimonas mengyeensis]
MKKLTLFLLIVAFGWTAQAQEKGSVLIQNATVITITDGDLEDTDVLIRDGIIERIGKDLNAPRGVETIDASGKYVMPGIIDAHSHLNGVDINEPRNPVTAEVTMEESVDPNEVGIYHSLAGGVTSIHLMHGSANVIGGQGETLKLRYGADQEGLKFEDAPRTIKFALGENPTRVHGQGNSIQPRTRMGVEQIIRNHFDEALDYKRKREAYLEAKQGFDRNGRGTPPVPVAKNLRYEILNDIIEGEILVHCHSYRADEILMLVRVFNDYGIENYTFQHANEAFKVAPELAKHGAHTSVFSDWWAYKFEVYYSTAYNASILNANGVINSINSDNDQLQRTLNHEAAKVVRYGNTSVNDALKMITLHPAIQLGIDDRVGSIEEGKDGDVAIWSGHPFDIYSKAEMTFVDGKKYFDLANDADDMRIHIEPGTKFEDGSHMREIVSRREADACLQDAFILFGEQSAQQHN